MNNTFEWMLWRDVALTYRTVMNFRMLFVYKVHILKKADTIIIFCIMKMLKKRIRCISVLVQLFVQWYISCINITTTRKINQGLLYCLIDIIILRIMILPIMFIIAWLIILAIYLICSLRVPWLANNKAFVCLFVCCLCKLRSMNKLIEIW